jgi:hypothetical protein
MVMLNMSAEQQLYGNGQQSYMFHINYVQASDLLKWDV